LTELLPFELVKPKYLNLDLEHTIQVILGERARGRSRNFKRRGPLWKKCPPNRERRKLFL